MSEHKIRNLFVYLLTVPLATFFVGIILFLLAGTIIWLEAWIYLAIFFAFMLSMILYFGIKSPETLLTRGKAMPKEKWDKILTPLYSISFMLLFIIPPFDAIRFQWFPIPFWIEIIGAFGTAISFLIILLVMKENAFASKAVIIHEDKGHEVITTGPYKIIRHPMYAGFFIMAISTPICLGSLFTLIPAVISIGLISIRIHYEDKLLHEKLKGYKEYAQKTKYKIIPGIW